MVQHHINEDRRSGYFSNEYGYKICQWSWDCESSVLRVRVGFTERPVHLESTGLERLSGDELLVCLAGLARSTGEELGANFGPECRI